MNSGTKGSRVSVVHGQVVVDHSGEKKVPGSGEQMATHQSTLRCQCAMKSLEP